MCRSSGQLCSSLSLRDPGSFHSCACSQGSSAKPGTTSHSGQQLQGGSGLQNVNDSSQGKIKKTQRAGTCGGWEEKMTFLCFCSRRRDDGLKVGNFISQALKKYTSEDKTAPCLFPFSPLLSLLSVLMREESWESVREPALHQSVEKTEKWAMLLSWNYSLGCWDWERLVNGNFNLAIS